MHQGLTIELSVSVRKLFQLGDILRMTYREVKRDVEGFVIVTLMEEGDFVAQTTGKPGFRLFEILGRHHWNGTYFDEDGFIVPPDRPIFESQIIHLDDPTKKKEVVEICLFSPTEDIEEQEGARYVSKVPAQNPPYRKNTGSYARATIYKSRGIAS